jgi:hypothetical protein
MWMFLPALLSSAGDALAIEIEEATLSWNEVASTPPGRDRPAMGPDRLAVGPDGELAWWNPASRRVEWRQAGGVLRLEVGAAAEGLCFLPTGELLVLAANRRLLRYGRGGALEQRMELPERTPTGVELAVWQDRVVGVDRFGNGHGVARWSGAGLQPWEGRSILDNPHPVRRSRDEAGVTIDWEGGQHRVPGALEASGRDIGGWLVVDAVVDDRPIHVQRLVFSAEGAQVSLPVAGRLYAPTQDLAAGPDGRLVVMDPRADGLHIWTVRP